jgi:glutamine cyclotransferase
VRLRGWVSARLQRRPTARESLILVTGMVGYPVSVKQTVAVALLAGTLVGAAYHWIGIDAAQQRTASQSLPTFGYSVVRTYPHDRDAFTQGLQYLDGQLYEGTGLRGRSSIRRVNLQTGAVSQRLDLDRPHFGEGITVLNGELFQLTWQSGVAFVYDSRTFDLRRSFRYRGEGWGLTHDRTHLIMSDGTDALRFLDPATFTEQRRVRVTADGVPVRALNELEYINGEIWTNIWGTDRVARVDPRSGHVTAWVDFSGLLTQQERLSADVLNGIAYDEAGDRIFVTGKLWPKLFEIRIVPR